MGTFRYDDEGRLAEEWVQTGYRGLLAKLGVIVTESVTPNQPGGGGGCSEYALGRRGAA
jgi:hypothetical protein